MLTIKSRMFSANRIGTEVTEEDLQALKQLLTCDYRNFRGKDNKISFGFTSATAEVIVERADMLVSKDAKICILNDLSLEMYLTLLKAGYKRENIYIAVGNWTEGKGKAAPDMERNTTLLFHHHVSTSFVEDINIISLEEFLTMTFDLIIANPPYELGNDITRCAIESMGTNTQYINIMPISKYKKGKLSQHIIPGSIMLQTRARETSDFDGADTYPVICTLSKQPTNNLTFKEFEQQYCCNREEGLGKKFFEEQDKRIAAEAAGLRPKAFVLHAVGVRDVDFAKFDSKTSISTNIWTPHIAHGWGAQQVYADVATLKYKEHAYIDWNFRKVNKPINEVFNVCHSKTGDTIAQTQTVCNTEAGKDNMLAWMHSAERNGKYRHCGLFTILLRWMNKSTCCPYDLIIPRVDWDSRTWTDEEILRDYGYTEEEIENILHYNDDLIPARWKA